jgi:hypothetical protein
LPRLVVPIPDGREQQGILGESDEDSVSYFALSSTGILYFSDL